jgi:hypothetical protein
MSISFASKPAAPVSPSTDCATDSVQLSCNDIWMLASFTYDPTLVHDDSYVPDRGTYAELIHDIDGFACAYTSPRNGNRITIAIARADFPGSFDALQGHIAATSTQVLTFGPPSEIQVYKIKGIGSYAGDYEIFVNGYWISLTSNLFHTPNGATTLIQAVIQTLSRG